MSRTEPTVLREDIDLDALQRVDPRLVALALGRIDAGELEELMARAVREPEVRSAVNAFWPLDEASKHRSFAKAQDLLAGRENRLRRPHWLFMFMPTCVATAFAVGVTLIGVALQPLPLPEYGLEVRGGLRPVRSATDDLTVGRMAPKAPLELIFRPSRPIDGRASAAVFRVNADDLLRLESLPEVSDSGSVRWRGTINSLLPGERGTVELILAVRSGERPPTAAEVRLALQNPTPSVRFVRTALVIDPP